MFQSPGGLYGKQKGLFQTIKKEFCFEDFKVNKPFPIPVNNRMYVILEFSCQFNHIKLIRLTIMTGVNSCVIIIDTKLSTDAIKKVVENQEQHRYKDSPTLMQTY